ncbi:MAG: hypothetical protein AAF764_03300 [Pseudomonadota bacterium]
MNLLRILSLAAIGFAGAIVAQPSHASPLHLSIIQSAPVQSTAARGDVDATVTEIRHRHFKKHRFHHGKRKFRRSHKSSAFHHGGFRTNRGFRHKGFSKRSFAHRGGFRGGFHKF